MLEILLKNLNKFGSDLKLFLEKKLELFTLETADKTTDIMAVAIVFVFVGAFFLLALNFALHALADILSSLISFPAAGELIVFVVLSFISLIFFASRKSLTANIKKSLLDNFMNKGIQIEEREFEKLNDKNKNPSQS